MNRRALPVLLLAAAVAAQGPDMLVTYSQQEQTLSLSGGTVLQRLLPNEIAYLDWSTGPCANTSAEKWAPRTAFHTMAGDEDANGFLFSPLLFGRIDALCVGFGSTTAVGGTNLREVFWSPEVAMGPAVAGAPSLRPGDVGRIVRQGVLDGQVEYFMRQEQFNQALGLPLATPIDIDAITFQPGFGVFFSLDQDTPANTFCGPTFVRDGDVVAVPDWAITWTPDFRVAAVVPNSATVVFTEAQIQAMVINAGVANHLGNCVNVAIDLESLEFDWNGAIGTVVPCAGAVLQAPNFVFSVETTTGAGLLTTAGGGQIYNHLCGPAAMPCGGITMGPQMGIRPATAAMGAPSFVNALAFGRAFTHVLEPQQHVMNVPLGAPMGFNRVDYNSPFAANFVFVELVGMPVPQSLPAFPFSLLCFPDIYTINLIPYGPVFGQFGSFPVMAIPPALPPTKLLFQSVGIGGSGFELSTPAVIDIN